MTHMRAVQLWEAEECTPLAFYMYALNLQMLAVPRKLAEEYLLAAVTGCTARMERSIQYSCCPECGRMHCSLPFPLVLNIAGNAQQAPWNYTGCLNSFYRSAVEKSEPLKHW